jgi:hypothetical protein
MTELDTCSPMSWSSAAFEQVAVGGIEPVHLGGGIEQRARETPPCAWCSAQL